jgi:hypothetical protein
VTLTLVVLAIFFAYLAYDAYRLRSPDRSPSAEEIAKGLGQDISHLSAAERIRFADWHRRRGLGRPSQMVWLFVILTIGCVAAALAIWFDLL